MHKEICQKKNSPFQKSFSQNSNVFQYTAEKKAKRSDIHCLASNLSTPYTMQDWFDNASNYGPNKKKSEFEFQILWKLACVIKFRWHWWNFSIVIDSACLENDPLSISNMAFCGHPPRDMVGYDKVIKSRQNQTHLQFSINFSLTAAAELWPCIGYI